MNFLVVDDHAIVRLGLKQLLAEFYPHATVTEAASGEEALRLIDQVRWDLLIVDVNLPDRNGLDVLKAATHRPLPIPVVVLTLHPEAQYAVRALKAGAAAYLTKDRAPQELSKAIARVLTGHKFVTATLAERLANELQTPADYLPHERLSDRELQVLCAIGQGKSMSEIANDYALSVKTVSTYRTRLLEKLKLKNTAELIRYAIDHALA